MKLASRVGSWRLLNVGNIWPYDMRMYSFLSLQKLDWRAKIFSWFCEINAFWFANLESREFPRTRSKLEMNLSKYGTKTKTGFWESFAMAVMHFPGQPNNEGRCFFMLPRWTKAYRKSFCRPLTILVAKKISSRFLMKSALWAPFLREQNYLVSLLNASWMVAKIDYVRAT